MLGYAKAHPEIKAFDALKPVEPVGGNPTSPLAAEAQRRPRFCTTRVMWSCSITADNNFYGQTEAMVQRCYRHKIKKLFYQKGRPTLSGRPYDIIGWIESLRASSLLIHVPILPVLDDREEKLFEAE